MIKLYSYRFGRLRREKIFAELLKGGVIRLGCFETLFGGLFQFRLRLPGIRGGSLKVGALRPDKLNRGLDHPLL